MEFTAAESNTRTSRCTDKSSNVNGSVLLVRVAMADKEKWCMYPANNYLSSGTKIAIAKCMDWESFTWTVDDEGKIKNFKDPSLCMHMQGKRLLIKTCVDGLRNQIWRYNTNKHLFLKNGQKGAMVEGGVAFQNAVVKHLAYKADDVIGAEKWDLQFSGVILFVPLYDTFTIISDLTTDGKKWCIFPANNYIDNGVKIALSTCNDWPSFLWTMDYQGRMKNVKDPTKCITRLGKRMQLNSCANNFRYQRWAYDVIDRKLSLLLNGRMQATVVNKEAAFNTQVRSLPSEVDSPSYQTWALEDIS